MIRTSILILFTFSLPVSSFSQRVVRKGVTPVNKPQPEKKSEKISPDQFRGKWQEVKRMAGKQNIGFTDTLYLNFFKRDSVITRNGGMEMSQKGLVQVDGNRVFFAGDDYGIVKFQKHLVLDDGEYIRTLESREAFYADSLGLIKVPKENIKDPVAINANLLKGKWFVYRTQSVPGESVPDSILIRNIEFKETGGKMVTGSMSVQKKGSMETVPFEALINEKEMHIKTTVSNWNLRFYKISEKEIIFGNMGGIVYFAKQF
ncbi:MAG: hypothetical protein EOO01_29850 [Chitinophagaceae bacterium]|nr:MAG: hypothetical protein EOO01_29850 [Chitinophagaceae bacterium]